MDENKNQILRYILSQWICLFIHLIIILILSINGYNAALYFLYVIPAILLFMFVGYCYWIYDISSYYNFCTLVLIITIPIFFGVFFGVLDLTLQYNLTYINECKVIGQIKAVIPGCEQYQILYVNFKLKGENMLGYSCSSSNYQQAMDIMPVCSLQLYPNAFLFSGDYLYYYSQYPPADISENESNIFTITKEDGKQIYNVNYIFSEVKLPSWMCSSPNPSSQDLLQLNSCYVHFYQGKEGTVEEAFQNSKNRQDLRKAKSFAYVSFTNLLAPLSQFMCFLVFIYCPMIVGLSVFFLPFSESAINQLYKYKSRLQWYSKIKPGSIAIPHYH